MMAGVGMLPLSLGEFGVDVLLIPAGVALRDQLSARPRP
jgi:hypothetical protein